MLCGLCSDSTAEILLRLAGSRNIAMLDRHEALGRAIICDFGGYYGVHRAAACGYIDVVEWFLDHGMDVNVLDARGQTFGLIGACSGYFDILHLFVDLGGNEESLEYLGMNALQKSIFFGESDADILTMINDAEHSSLLTARTSHFGFHACHFAAHFGRLNVLRALVAAGADPDASSMDLLTPFHLAAQRGHLNVMKYLFSIGVNVNTLSNFCENAAHFAAAFGDVDVLHWLDSISVDMCCNSAGRGSILTCAGEANQLECCRWLLEEGGFHHLLEDFPSQDLTRAFETQNLPIARLLLSHGAHLADPMRLACTCFHPGLLDLCVEFEAVSANNGFVALLQKDWDAFEWLVSHGYFPWTQAAFDLPHFSFRRETFRELKHRGFDFHILNEKGQNLFFCYHMDPFFLGFLIEEGLDPNVVDVDGNYAWNLSLSEMKKHILIVIGACPHLDHDFLEFIESQVQASDVLPDCVDIWDVDTDVTNAATLRLWAIRAIMNLDKSLIMTINQHYPLALFAAAIVVPRGVDILKECGIVFDFDELHSTLEEMRLVYLANRCHEEKLRGVVSLDRMQLL